jgi:hypothetical protein
VSHQDSDEDNGGQGAGTAELVCVDAGDPTIDNTGRVVEVAKGYSLEAINTILMVMRSPGRNSVAQLGAARMVLEFAGLGTAEAVYERVIKALRAELSPADAQRVLKRLMDGEKR